MIEFEVTKISTGEKRRFDLSDLSAFELQGINSPEDCDECDGVWINFKDEELDDWKLSGNCGFRRKQPLNPDLKIQVIINNK